MTLKVMLQRLKRRAAKEDGAVSLEFAIWTPFLITIMVFGADVSMTFMRQANMWQATRDAARIVSRHGMTEAEAESYIQSQINWSADYTPSVDVTISGGQVTVTVDADFNELAPFGLLSFVTSNVVRTSMVHAMEPS